MNGKASVILGVAGVGIGSALMYWFDPAVGKRRRAHARYQTRRVVRRVQKVVDATAHGIEKLGHVDFSAAARGLVPARAKALIWR